MKKSKMGIIITALIMIVAGSCLCIGGVMAAGGLNAAKNALIDSNIKLNHIFEFEVDEDGFDIDYELGNHETVNHLDEMREAEHHSDEIAQKAQGVNCNPAMYGTEIVKSLKLEIGAAKVEFVCDSSVSEITMQTKDNFDTYVKNGVLHIKSQNSMKEHVMRLEIPQNVVFENIEMKGNSCEIIIPYIEVKEFDIEADAGFVQIEELIADKAEFEIGAGQIVVNDGNVIECDVNVGMGNFEYHGSVTKHGDIECGMGNAELYLEAAEKDYNYEVECDAGNVTIGDSAYGGLSVKKMVNNYADAVIEIDCSVGNVVIGF